MVITWVAPYGPALKAGVKPGDRLLSMQDNRVSNVPDFSRNLWKLGAAGVDVPLKLSRKGKPMDVVVKSADRYDFLHMKRSYYTRTFTDPPHACYGCAPGAEVEPYPRD